MASKTVAQAFSEQEHKIPNRQSIRPTPRRPSPLQIPDPVISEGTTPTSRTAESLVDQTAARHEKDDSPSTDIIHTGIPGSSCMDNSSGDVLKQLTLEDHVGKKLQVDSTMNLGENGGLEQKVLSVKGSAKDTSASAEPSDNANDRAGIDQRNVCRESTSSNVSDESTCSSMSSAISKPHKANDPRWEAIQMFRARDGMLGLSHFRLLKSLGSGDIGSVYLSELAGTKCYFAMKVMDKGSLASRKKLLRAQTEREILQLLDHPFLPTLYTHFETDKFSCLVMEFCPGGDLHILRQRQPGKYFPEQAVKFYVAEVLLALEYLHMLGIIYRDLKPENVLVREDGHIMLSDFDLSLQCAASPTLVKSSTSSSGEFRRSNNPVYCAQPACIQPSCVAPTTCFSPRLLFSKSKERRQKTDVGNQVSPLPELIVEPTDARSMSFVGTHEYLAPEIIKGEGHGSAVDWWTFGIFLYELLFGKTPFKGAGNRATLFNVIGQPLRFPDFPVVSFAARDLIRGLLVKEPQHRLAYKRGATEIKQHAFFEGVSWALIRCANPPEVPKPFEMEMPAMASTSQKNNTPSVEKISDNYLEFNFF